MGICLSKKKKAHCSPPPPTHEEKKEKTKEVVVVVTHQHQHQQQMQQPPKVVEETHERKQVFLITPSKKKQQQLPTTQQPEVVKAPEVVEKKAELPMKDVRRDGALLVEEARMAPVRTSSCTKEEVESILIQCGRLSRSSSGKGETSAGGRKYSGSKRSYDFDNERKEEEEWEKGPSSSRPSPRRRAPSRERSNSRERGSSGGRRVSRSPGRRSDGMSSSNSSVDKSRQPGKMVSVPAREKSNSHPVAEDGGMGRRRAPSPSKGVVRSSSPRSRSPANIRASNENAHVQHPPPSQQPQTLSRSSSRKAEHSPYRRNPMAEIDDNVVRAEHPLSRKTEGMRKASSQTHSQKSKSEQRNGGGLENPNGSNGNPINRRVREQLPSCKAKEQLQQQLREQEIVDEAADAKGPPPKATEVIETVNPRTITRTRSSRRSSRDLDALLGFNPEVHLNPTSYTSLLLEDIQSYHQQNTTFSLPVCVSKACSILEAVADLNSSSSENKVASEAGGHSNNDNCSSNGQMGGKGLVGQKDGFVESEVGVKNDLMEPSFHKYVSVRDKLGLELEPQESAGSNSFVGQPWASTWEPNSVDSSDRCWTSSWSGEEVEGSEEHSPLDSGNPRHQQQKHQALSEVAHELEARGKKHSRSVSMSNSLTAATTSSSRKREFDHRQQRRGVSGLSGNGKSGIGRASSTPVAAAASS